MRGSAGFALCLPFAPFAVDNRSMDKRSSRAVVVRNVDDAIRACRAAADSRHTLIAVSPPGAASFAGPLWFKALTSAARKATGARKEVVFALDCADAPGSALAAIRVGVEAIVFGGTGTVRGKIAAIAARAGVIVLGRKALDLACNSESDTSVDRFSSRGASLQRPRPSAKRTATRGSAPRRSGSGAKPPSRGANRP